MAHWSNVETPTDLERELTNHRPTQEAIDTMKNLRRHAFEYGVRLLELPPSRYRSQALTTLKDSTMWAMAAVALDPENTEESDPLW